MNLLVVIQSMRKEYEKIAHDLTTSERADLPKKDFAVPAKKSNTHKPAYPIPDAQHARSALGFAKMHGDTADYAKVRAKVEKKFPGMIEKKGGAACLPDGSGFMTGTVGKIKGKEKDSNMMGGGSPESYNAAKLPSSFQAPQVQGAAQMGKMGGALQRIGEHLHGHEGMHEVAGLGVLAIPGLDHLQARGRALLAGDKGPGAAEKRQLLGETGHSALDVGGLGYLAAPTVAKHLMGH